MTDTQAATPDPIDLLIEAQIDEGSAPLEPENIEATPQTDEPLQEVEPVAAIEPEHVETENDKVQKRINKMHFEKMEEKRRADALETRLQQLEATNAQTIAPIADSEEPTLAQFKEEDYDYDESARNAAYTSALVDHRLNKTLDTRDGQLAEQQRTFEQQRRQAEIADKYLNEAVEYSTKHPAYMEDIQNLPVLPQDKLDLLKGQGAKMVHYLSKNPEMANQFANSDFGSAAVQLGQLSAQLNNAKPPTQISSAPAPVDTVSGTAGSLAKPIEEMSMEEIMAT
jgi:hypothetical protein